MQPDCLGSCKVPLACDKRMNEWEGKQHWMIKALFEKWLYAAQLFFGHIALINDMLMFPCGILLPTSSCLLNQELLPLYTGGSPLLIGRLRLLHVWMCIRCMCDFSVFMMASPLTAPLITTDTKNSNDTVCYVISDLLGFTALKDNEPHQLKNNGA